jgi:hypothetical protein
MMERIQSLNEDYLRLRKKHASLRKELKKSSKLSARTSLAVSESSVDPRAEHEAIEISVPRPTEIAPTPIPVSSPASSETPSVAAAVTPAFAAGMQAAATGRKLAEPKKEASEERSDSADAAGAEPGKTQKKKKAKKKKQEKRERVVFS